jgi:hypothetical protein
VAQRDEVGVLREAVDDGEDDRLLVDLGQSLDEIHRDVRPHLRWHLERLQQPRRLQRLGLVALASGTRPNPVPNQRLIMWDVEIGAQAMEGLLDALVAGRVRQVNNLVA